MAQEYFPAQKPPTNLTHPENHSPALTEDDEEFLRRLTSPDLNEQEIVIFDEKGKASRGLAGADQVPLPVSPPVVEEKPATPPRPAVKESKSKRKLASMFTSIRSSLPVSFGKKQEKSDAAEHIHDIATSVKTGESLVEVSKEDEEKEKADMTSILDQLNLAAVNNRAFSFSQESKRLMEQFTQILKDIINGVPTAYDDLEKLLTNSDKQLKGMYDKMPPFLQNLVKSLPSKMTATIAPGLLAAASEKPGADAKIMQGATGTKKKRSGIPLLKNLVKGDAVIAMLKSILNFLKFRFPTFIGGTNILLSLAVFLLLFVFWYCYKRGRETRLEKDRLAAEGQSDLESSSELEDSVLEETPNQSTADARKLEDALRHPPPASVPLPDTPNEK